MRYLVAAILCLMMGVGLYAQSPCNNQTSVTYQGYELFNKLLIDIANPAVFQLKLNPYLFVYQVEL